MAISKVSDDPKDQRYLVQVYNPAGGSRLKKVVTGKKAAEQVERDLKTKANKGTATVMERKRTFASVLEEVIGSKILATNTRLSYRNAGRNLLPEIGHLPINSLSRRTLFVVGVLNKIEQTKGPAARRTAESLARMTFRAAVNDDIMDRNPLAGERFPAATVARKQYRPDPAAVLTIRDAIGCMKNTVPGEDVMLRAAVEVLYGTGVRIGELLGIDLEQDYDPQRRVLSIKRQVLYLAPDAEDGRPEGTHVYAPTKNEGSVREIPLPPFVVAAFAATKLRNGEEPVTMRWSGPDLRHASSETHNLLFFRLREAGQPIHPRTLAGRISRVGKRLGLPGALHPHAFRHAYTTELHDRGVPQKAIEYVTGHLQPGGATMTMGTYTGVTPASLGKVRVAIQQAWEEGNDSPTTDASLHAI